MNESNPNLVIYVHLPKTGGTSLHESLCEIFPSFNHIIGGDQVLLNSDLENLDFIYGHFRLSAAKKLFPKAKYITLIRNPIDRLLSAIRYSKSIKKDDFNSLGPSMWHMKLLSVSNFLDTEYAYHEGRMQSAMLSSFDNIDSVDNYRESIIEDFKQDKILVGITERFQDSLKFFSKKLDIGSIDYKESNRTPDKVRNILNEELDPEHISKAQNLLKDELDFYKKVYNVFEQKINSL